MNYNKRSISLPHGCKDLADLLRRKVPNNTSELQHRIQNARHTFSESRLVAISELPKYVKMGFETHSLMLYLGVGEEDGPFKVSLSWLEGELQPAMLLISGQSGKAAAVRALLKARGISVPPDVPVPETFDPGLPVFCMFDISNPATNANDLGALLRDLMPIVQEGSQVYINCEEFSEGES